MNQTHCYLHETPRFGNYVDIVTAALILLSLIFDALVFFFSKYLSLYGEEDYDGMLGGVRMVPLQEAQTGASEPLLQPVGVANLTFDTVEPQSPPQSPEQFESLTQSPEPTREVSPKSVNRPKSQVVYAEILRTAPTVMAERQARAASSSPKNSPKFRTKTPSPTPVKNGRDSPVLDFTPIQSPPNNQSLSPLSNRSVTTSHNSSSGASYILPTGPAEKLSRSTGFKERLMREPLPDPKVTVPVENQINDLRALSPETPETNF